ncbi:MAG: RHS repeat-associated core domain-containing protein [Thermoanaerobaculia bacterium]
MNRKRRPILMIETELDSWIFHKRVALLRQEALDDGALTLHDLDADQEVPIAVSLPVVTGRQAHRRVVIAPPGPLAAGTNLQLILPAGSLIDEFFNVAQADFQIQFAWPLTDAIILDETPPQLESIFLLGAFLELEFSEEPDLTTTEAILVDGSPTDWVLDETNYRLQTTNALAEGVHDISIATGLADLAGRQLESDYQSPFEVSPLVPNLLVFDAGDPRFLTTSAILNALGFHGLEHDSETGFVYMRNRYYDPELGRFISADPLGYVDGPSAYGFAGNTPYNSRDPMGLYQEDFHYYVVYYMAMLALGDSRRATRIAFAAQYVDDYPGTAPIPDPLYDLDDPGFYSTLRDFHFPEFFGGEVVAGTENELVRTLRSKAINSGNDIQLGIFLHTFADSFSHAGFSALPSSGNDRGLPADAVGHLHYGETPDYPFKAPQLAAAAAIEVYEVIREYGEQLGIARPVVRVDTDQLRDSLEIIFGGIRGPKSNRIDEWYWLLQKNRMPAKRYDPTMTVPGLAQGIFLALENRQREWVREFGKTQPPQVKGPPYVGRFWRERAEEQKWVPHQ